jgi:hypothetical protein
MSEQALMNYFNFDQADLSLNRELHFSRKQQDRLLKEVKSSNIWGVVIGIGLVLIAAPGLSGFIRQVILKQDAGFGMGAIAFGLIWALVWGGVGVNTLVGSFTRHSYRIAKVQGQVNLVRTGSHNKGHTNVLHELHIGGQEFSVSEGLADVIMQGDEYIVYYVAPRHDILSAELVSKAK